jgi:hypothetical protein
MRQPLWEKCGQILHAAAGSRVCDTVTVPVVIKLAERTLLSLAKNFGFRQRTGTGLKRRRVLAAERRRG